MLISFFSNRILKQNGKLASVWKLLADVCILVAQLPKKISYLNLSVALLEKNHENFTLDETVCAQTEQLLNFALK